MKFVATKEFLTKKIFHPSLFYLFLDPGSEIRDPGSGMGKNQDPGFGIRDKHPGSATLEVAQPFVHTSTKLLFIFKMHCR